MGSCGGTGGDSSNSGNQFVFTARGRLSLAIQTTNDPRKILVTATLIDPQGRPFRNTRVTFTADFPDATFIPGDNNQSSVTTNDSGQATVTLIAGLTLGRMRILAEAPTALNLATGFTVELTEQGFISLGDLEIIPAEVIFINPLIGPESTDNPMTVFQATGGDPPYQWNNSNKDLGKIEPTGIENVNETAKYTLLGPIPTNTTEALQDTITLTDAAGNQATATVTVIFAECSLILSPAGSLENPGNITLDDALGGEEMDIPISNGVPPYTVTHTVSGAGNVIVDDATSSATYTVATPPLPSVTDTVLIRDSRGCAGAVNITYTAATILIQLAANPASGTAGFDSTITALVTNESGTPIEGITVLFSTTHGELDQVAQETDEDGKAVVMLDTTEVPEGTSITVTGTARGQTDSVVINVNPLLGGEM